MSDYTLICENRLVVPIWEKANLTVREAAAYSGIGESSIREMLEEKNTFAFRVGNKWLINRELFDEHIRKICAEIS